MVVMLPFAASSRVDDFEQTTRWMLESRYFEAQMLNGYSGVFPPDHAHLREQMLTFPTPDGIALLRELGVDYVVVHHHLPDTPLASTISQQLRPVFEDGANRVIIYSLE